mgnify:CR=1 FL=1
MSKTLSQMSDDEVKHDFRDRLKKANYNNAGSQNAAVTSQKYLDHHIERMEAGKNFVLLKSSDSDKRIALNHALWNMENNHGSDFKTEGTL